MAWTAADVTTLEANILEVAQSLKSATSEQRQAITQDLDKLMRLRDRMRSELAASTTSGVRIGMTRFVNGDIDD